MYKEKSWNYLENLFKTVEVGNKQMNCSGNKVIEKSVE